MVCAIILGVALVCLCVSLVLLVRHHQQAKRMHEHSIMLDDDALPPPPPAKLSLKSCLKCEMGCWIMLMVGLCLASLLLGFFVCVLEGPKLIVDPVNATNTSVNITI